MPDGSTTTTTIAWVPPIPPELIDDPRLPFLVDPGESDAGEIPLAQFPFDPRSVAVLPDRVAAATSALEASQATLRSVQEQLALGRMAVASLSAEVQAMDASSRAAVRAAASARRKLLDNAVSAYMTGRVDKRLAFLDTADMVDMGVARRYIDTIVGGQQRLLRDYESKRSVLSGDHAALAAQLGEGEANLVALAKSVDDAFREVADAAQQLRAYEAGAHAYVAGFVFPVAGDVEFIDSWGYPRMTGTASAHWHQGTDIFTQMGTPLIAAENGVIDRLGTASLGGNKLWVKADSGNAYYYAHLSAFAEGITEGMRVTAGQLVGYAGDTGNAKGTSPHLHFEIHPDGGDAVNPYPLLKAAYGARPVARAVVVPTVPAAVPAVDPAASGAPQPGG